MPQHSTKPDMNSEAGFTLVEVMVVMLIIGLMAGLVILNFPEPPNPVHAQGQKMASRLQLVSQASMVESQSFGINVDGKGYSVVRYENNGWQDIAHYDFEFETTPVLTLSQNGAELDLKALAKTNVPAIRYDTTGIATPFELTIETQRAKAKLVGDVDARIAVTLEGG